MKVTLEISDDADLRESVRAAIKTQVDNIVRAEMPKILGDVVSERIAASGYGLIDRLLKEQYRRAIESRAKAAAGKPMPVLIREIVAELFVDRFGQKGSKP